MFHSRSFAPRFLLATLLVLGLAVAGPSCSGGDDSKNEGKGGDGGTGPVAEVCDNDVDDDENGLTDCQDTACERTEICCPECFTQCGELGQAACASSLSGKVEMVCNATGVCEHGSQVDADGEPVIGQVMVMGQMREINPTMDYGGVHLRVISKKRPNTSVEATCDAIMKREIDPANPNDVNVVWEAGHPTGAELELMSVDLANVPLPREGDGRLAVVRFFGPKPDSRGNMRGDIVGEGCEPFGEIPAGDRLGDEANPARTLEVDIRLFCGGYLDRECPEPKSCVFGLCRDTRCGTCGPGQTCREWNGVPECRKSCNPDQPDCPNLHRCDASPGEVAACVPAE